MQQIQQGAPVDVFISAGKPQMDQLQNEGLNCLIPSRQDILGNDLVLVVPANETNIKDCQDLFKPELVKWLLERWKLFPPAKYAQETLNSLGIWNQLEPKLVMGSDVKQVLAYVEAGNAEAGFIYRSDIIGSQKVKVAAVIGWKTPFTNYLTRPQ